MTTAAEGIHAHATRKLGARAPKNAPILDFSKILTGTAPSAPFRADYLPQLAGTWKMLGNDAAGDCEAVRWANNRYLVTAALTDKPNYPDQDQVWAIYKTQNPGFDPAGSQTTDGPGSPHDQGMDSQTLAEYLHGTGGPDGVKLVAFAGIDPTNLGHVQLAIDVFGAVWVDIIVLKGNQDQFARKIPWTVDGSVDGGHAVLGAGADPGATGPSRPAVDIETWAAETGLTMPFWTGHVHGHPLVTQVIVPIWPEHCTTRQFDQAINTGALVAEYHALTGKNLVLPKPA